jgi:uncharacterized membrane protein YfcA
LTATIVDGHFGESPGCPFSLWPSISATAVAGDCRTETLLAAALIVFAGYTLFGVTGFGASPITVPVLAHLPLPFVLAGLFDGRDLWLAIGVLLPVAWAGVWTGKRVHMRLAPATVARIVGAGLLVSGASLIVRAL